MIHFRNINILMFSPQFFGYEKEIANRLRELEANVSLHDERPSNTFFIKVLIRIKPHLLKKWIINYYNRILNKNTKEFDYVFFFKGETAIPEVINLIKISQPNAKVILYLIDSIANYPHLATSLHLFHKILSFDTTDALNYKSIDFRPLFYLNEYSTIQPANSIANIDILFIGTIHSDRWRFLEDIKHQAEREKLTIYYYLYFQSPIIFFIKKIFNKQYRTIPITDARFNSLSKPKVLELIGRSKVIIDIQHPKQSGLTIRSIEVFGARRKLITTNSNIEGYDLFNKNNICVIDRLNPIIDLRFVKSEPVKEDSIIFNKYSLDSWLKDVFFAS